MYDLPEVVEHTNAMWSAIGSRIPNAPKWLTRPSTTEEMHALWRHPELVLGQTCGWPLVTELSGLVKSGALKVVGTFWYHTSHVGGYYSAHHVTTPLGLSARNPRSAVNSYESLSGWVSHAYRNTEAITSVLLTGSHVETLRAIRDDRADMGSIDAVTHDLLLKHRPSELEGVTVSDGELTVPCLPLITTRPVEQIRDRRDSPWDDPDRRPSHADRRKALRRQTLQHEYLSLSVVQRCSSKIRSLYQRLLQLTT